MKLPHLSPQGWLTAQIGFSQVFSLVLFAVQAPLLGPTAFELVAIVMVFVGFCESVLEVAAAEALVSVRQIEPIHYRTMTTVIGGLGVLIGISAFALAGPVARLFGEPALADVLQVMCLLPLLSALCASPSASARREMRFQALAIRGIAGVGVSGVVGIVLAVLGFGVWALVWQALVQRAVTVVVMWLAVPLPFRFGYSGAHLRELWRYGGPMLVAESASWSTSQIPRFLLGLFFGPTEVGFLSLAGRISDLIVQMFILAPFTVARIEMRRFLDDASDLLAAVQALLRRMAVLVFPLAIGGALVTPLVFELWLDDKWTDAIPVTRLMLLGCMPYVVHYALSSALLGLNRQGAIATNSLIQSVTTAVSIPAAAPFGFTAAIAAYAIRPLLTASIPMLFLRREAGVPLRVVVDGLGPLLLAAIGMGLLLAAMQAGIGLLVVLPAWLLLPLLGIAGVAVYALLLTRLAPDALEMVIGRWLRRDR